MCAIADRDTESLLCSRSSSIHPLRLESGVAELVRGLARHSRPHALAIRAIARAQRVQPGEKDEREQRREHARE